MVKHTDKFIRKHLEILERRKKEAEQKIEKRALKKELTYKKKLDEKREKYKLMKKQNTEEYKEYLNKQKEYSKKRKIAKKEKVFKMFENEDYRVYHINTKYFYIILRNGEVYNNTGRRIKGYINKRSGYSNISAKSHHRLVWEAFNGDIPEGMEIDHINCRRNDNRLENLRLVTHKENCNNPISIENYKKHNKEVDRSYLRKKIS